MRLHPIFIVLIKIKPIWLFFIHIDECMDYVRLLHVKLLLENGSKHSTADAISNQCVWNEDPIDNCMTFNSFLMSIVGRDFDRRLKTFQDILTKCDDWSTEDWKYLLLLLRVVIETKEFLHFSPDEQNKFKALAKSKLTIIIHFVEFGNLNVVCFYSTPQNL